jgi:hypothetical protein
MLHLFFRVLTFLEELSRFYSPSSKKKSNILFFEPKTVLSVVRKKRRKSVSRKINQPRCPGFFFSSLTFFNHISRNEPGQNFFSNLTLLSRANPSDVTYKGVVPCTLTQLGSMLSHFLPRGLTRAARVALSDMARLSHTSSFDVTGPSKASGPLSFSSSSLSSSSSSFHLTAAP